jgi:hypothetical protein
MDWSHNPNGETVTCIIMAGKPRGWWPFGRPRRKGKDSILKKHIVMI